MILPDSATSPRWEANDRPLLQAAFEDAGIEADIQNADSDTSKFATICDGMINAGVSVLLIVNLDSDSGAACLNKAQDAGIETIDYDRLTLGGGASFYVSFDNVKVGALMGEGLEKCLTDAGKETDVNVVFINGAPTDNNATLFKQGYQEYLQPKIDSGDYTLVGDRPVSGTPTSPARRSSRSTRTTAARSTASCRPTTRWPAASSPVSRRPGSTARFP